MRRIKKAVRNALILSFYLSGLAALRRAMLTARHGILNRVICFHWIGAEGAADFEAKLVWLKDHFDIRPLAELLAIDPKAPTTRPIAAITFDDGYADLVDVVLPILRRHQLPIALFFPADALSLDPAGRLSFGRTNIGIDKPILSREQLQELLDSGLVDIQSHTRSHCDCGRADPKTLRRELGEGREMLQEATGRCVRLFAYPYGSLPNTSQSAREALLKCEYDAAWTIIPGFNHCDSDQFMLHRDSLAPDMNMLLFRAWLSGSYDVFKHIQNRQNHVR